MLLGLFVCMANSKVMKKIMMMLFGRLGGIWYGE